MRQLSPAQEAAVSHRASRLQLLACAGSGKTEVLARRAVRLLAEGHEPASIIAFTFTEKAAAELKARLEERVAEADARFRELPPVAGGMFVGTTHGWALEQLRRVGGLYEMMDPLDEEGEWALVHRMARRLGVVDLYAALEGKEGSRVAVAPAVDMFLRSVEVVHNERLDRSVLAECSPDFARALHRYEELLVEMRLMPFRLMIARAADELRPGGRLREALGGRIRHVLVDEAQDFNRAQQELLGSLAEMGAEITVVGDDDQAIYQWRGGDVSLFTGFTKRFPEAVRLELATNYRSRPEIVSFARTLAEKLPERLPKAFSAHREPLPCGAIELVVAPTPTGEAEVIAGRIQRLLGEGHRPGEIAVLFRSVRTSARPVVEALRRRGIPVAVAGHTSILAKPETALVVRLFVWWAGGADETATWYPNHDYVPEVVSADGLLQEIVSLTGAGEAKGREILQDLRLLGKEVRTGWVEDIVALYDRLLAVLGLPGRGEGARYRELGLGRLSELLTHFERAVRRAAPPSFYQNLAGAEVEEAQEDGALREVVDQDEPAKTEAARATRLTLGTTPGEILLVRLRAFLEHFAGRAGEEVPDEDPAAQDAVHVMTVHQAKGLEFPVVFVPSLVKGRFPSSLTGRSQSWYVPGDLFDRQRYEGREEDEARLLYVALTRAQELLVVSWFDRYEGKAPEEPGSRATPSPFLTRHLQPALSGARPFCSVRVPFNDLTSKEKPLLTDISSLSLYAECGYRYWLSRVCGFQPLLARELGFGKLLHHLVAELARQALKGREPRPEDVDRLVDRSFYLPFAGAIPVARLRESARRRIKAYIRGYGRELTRTVQPEMSFEVPLGNARLRGRVDLVLAVGEKGKRRVELVDFKTAENRPPSEVHKNQLRLYAAAVGQLGYEPVRLYVHDLDQDAGDRVEVKDDARARSTFEDELRRLVEGIQAGRFDPAAESVVCSACDFCAFCSYRA